MVKVLRASSVGQNKIPNNSTDDDMVEAVKDEKKDKLDDMVIPETLDQMFGMCWTDPQIIKKYYEYNKMIPDWNDFMKTLNLCEKSLRIVGYSKKYVNNNASYKGRENDYYVYKLKLKKRILAPIVQLIGAGYGITDDDHLMLFEKFDIEVSDINKKIDVLMKKTILTEQETKILLMLICCCSKIESQKKEQHNVNKISQIITALCDNKTERYIALRMTDQMYTVGMLNLFIASLTFAHSSPLKIKKILEQFKNRKIYPNYLSFRLLKERSYADPKNPYKMIFRSNSHKIFNDHLFAVYSSL
jgi:hypothetical protein